MILIPLQIGVPHYTMTTNLDSVTYKLRFDWNDRMAAWFLSIHTAVGEALVTGIRVVVSWPLTARFVARGVPPGLLEAIDTSGRGIDPGFEDLGTRVILAYTNV